MTPLRIIMLSYERGFMDPASEASHRLGSLADGDIRISAFVLSGRKAGDREDGKTRIHAVGGLAPVRIARVLSGALREIRRAKKAGERVIVTAQDPFVSGKIAFLLSRCTGVPYEIQEHGDFFSGYWKRERISHRLLTCIGRFVLRRADGVRVVSERIRDRFIREFGISPDRIIVNPVVQDLSWHLTRPIKKEMPDVPIIVAPCRFVRQKGLDVLLEALSLLKTSGTPDKEALSSRAPLPDKGGVGGGFRLRLVGSGSGEASLKKDIARLGLSSEVSIESWASQEGIWDNADLFVCSSRYEGWGRTIVEAMAAGVPIVTTDVGCVGSFFRPQIDGRIVQPEDANSLMVAIREQLTEHDRRIWMAENARERIASIESDQTRIRRQTDAWKILGEKAIKQSNNTTILPTAILLAFTTVIRAASVVLFWPSLGANREWGFFRLVESWFAGYGYSYFAGFGCASAYRSPGYLFFLTGVYKLFGFANFLAQAIIQNLFAIGIVYLVYRLGWTISRNRRIGLIAGFLAAIHPYAFYHYTQYYHTVLQSFFLLLLMFMFIRLMETRRMAYAFWTGVAIALLAYVQGTILPATVLLAVWLLYVWRKEWKRAIGAITVMAIVSIAIIAPWTIRNWNVFHEFVPLTTDLGLSMAKANTDNYPTLLRLGYPHEVLNEEVSPDDPRLVRYTYLSDVQNVLALNGGLHPSALWTEWHPREPTWAADRCENLSSVSEPEYNQYWIGKAKDWLVGNYWSDGWKLQLRKVATFWSPRLYPWKRYGASWSFGNDGIKAQLATWGYSGYVAAIELLAIAGLIFVFRRRSSLPDAHLKLVPILIVFVVYTAMHTIFAPYTKYRIPLDHLVSILAALGLYAIAMGMIRFFSRKK